MTKISSPSGLMAHIPFDQNETHGISLQKHSVVHKNSDAAKWSFAWLSYQTENPYRQQYSSSSHPLVGLNLSRPTKISLSSGLTVQSGRVPPGAFTLIPQNVPFEVTLENECDSLLLYVHKALWAGIGQELEIAGSGVPELTVNFCINDNLVETAARSLLSISDQISPQHTLLAEQICRTLALYVTSNYSTQNPDKIPSRATDFDVRLLSRIQGYILGHIAEPITLEQLAQISGLPLIRFQRAFKASTGFTPYQYVLKTRVEYARRLLEDQRTSLAWIAVESGFANQTHLTRVFKQFYGKTPGDWRKK